MLHELRKHDPRYNKRRAYRYEDKKEEELNIEQFKIKPFIDLNAPL